MNKIPNNIVTVIVTAYAEFTDAHDYDKSFALADKLSGVDQNPWQPDIHASFNSSHDFYFGTDGNPPANKYDFVTVVLHELIHGIGFTGGRANYDTVTLEGSIRHKGFYTIYDFFVVNGSGKSVASFADPSIALGSQMISDNLFIVLSGCTIICGKFPKRPQPQNSR